LTASSPDKQTAASVRLAAPLNESKGITRATNASQFYQKEAFNV
jgi:hypothetical protein